MRSTTPDLDLRPRPLAASVDELLADARRLGEFVPVDARSTSRFQRVELDDQPCVVKYVHPDDDFMMRVSGDLGCRSLRAWQLGLMDVAPDLIDHATIGVAPWGRNGWGAALLMHDVEADLVPPGDGPIPEADHLGFLDTCAGLAARTWGWIDEFELLPYRLRWAWFGPAQMAAEAELGFPEVVPLFAVDGWSQFAGLVPKRIADLVEELRSDPTPLAEALRTTPSSFLHGDWKFGNLGRRPDGRTVLIDWAYVGEGPVCHEIAWYLALNRARLPVGHTNESTIADLRSALERHGVTTEPWWQRQLDLCLLGGLVLFGWAAPTLPPGEIGWWCDAAAAGARWL